MEAKLRVKVLSHTPEPERVVSNSARLCYSELGIEDLFEKFTDEQNKGMIDRLTKMGHDSPLEHISITFGIEGISRATSHQLVRHRVGASYSQKSQRYVNEEGFEYIIPLEIKSNPEALEVFTMAMEQAQISYDAISTALFSSYMECDSSKPKDSEKKAMENARAVLPNACETKIIVTMNARALLNFFKLRSCHRAQDEIRELSDEMLRQAKKIAPSIFKYAGASCMFGKCPEGAMSCGMPRKIEEYE